MTHHMTSEVSALESELKEDAVSVEMERCGNAAMCTSESVMTRGPETYWQGAYWAPEEPSPYTNPCECTDLCMYVLCLLRCVPLARAGRGARTCRGARAPYKWVKRLAGCVRGRDPRVRSLFSYRACACGAAGCADPEGMEGCFSDSFQPWRLGWNKDHVYHN